jgi:hypothetical protein
VAACDEALKLPHGGSHLRAKALYRQGLSLMALSEFGRAKAALGAAAEIQELQQPEGGGSQAKPSAAVAALKKCIAKEKRAAKSEKAMFAKMFG